MGLPIRCMGISLRRLIVIALSLAFPSVVMACLWDYDTLMQERSRFPSALELITGKFPRHTKEFYQWRVKDRQQKIAATGSTPELLDDLAVAFDKLGDQTQAIATMELAEKQFPGRYQTAANLGTFYFHSKQYELGIPHIERALQINPEAHFGREKYQLLLVQFLALKQVDGQPKLPLPKSLDDSYLEEPKSFRQLVLKEIPFDQQAAEIEKATHGILGILRFGKHDSPVLLDVLGNLLYRGLGDRSNNQLLAARAYLQASYLTIDQPEVSASYRKQAESVLELQIGGTGENRTMTLADLEPEFQKELADAQQWSQTLANDEREWIAHSPDPEAAYVAKYSTDPKVPELTQRGQSRQRRFNLLLAVPCVAGLLLVVFIIYRARRRRSLNGASDTP